MKLLCPAPCHACSTKITAFGSTANIKVAGKAGMGYIYGIDNVLMPIKVPGLGK